MRSLRKIQEEDDQFNELHVTPQFQKYIAGKLSQILDKKLADTLSESQTIEQKHTVGCGSSSGGGVKLLRSSKNFLDIDFVENNTPKRKRVKQKQLNSEDFKEAAVEPQHILNQIEIKHWTKLYTKPHFVYKKNTATGEFVFYGNDQ